MAASQEVRDAETFPSFVEKRQKKEGNKERVIDSLCAESVRTETKRDGRESVIACVIEKRPSDERERVARKKGKLEIRNAKNEIQKSLSVSDSQSKMTSSLANQTHIKVDDFVVQPL